MKEGLEKITNSLNKPYKKYKELILIFGIVAFGLGGVYYTSYLDYKQNILPAIQELKKAGHVEEAKTARYEEVRVFRKGKLEKIIRLIHTDDKFYVSTDNRLELVANVKSEYYHSGTFLPGVIKYHLGDK